MSASSDGRQFDPGGLGQFDPGGLGHDDDSCLTLEFDQLCEMIMKNSIMKIKERNCDNEVILSEMKPVNDRSESISDSCKFDFNSKMSEGDVNNDVDTVFNAGAGAGVVNDGVRDEVPPNRQVEQPTSNEIENEMEVDTQVVPAQTNDGDGRAHNGEPVSQQPATEVNGTGARPRDNVDGTSRQDVEHPDAQDDELD